MEVSIYSSEGKEKGKTGLPEIFDTKASPALLHEVITGFLANQRAGTHSTKSRGEVSGGGLKPWRQKGTGRARSGSIRSPLWRKGGIIFGPKPKSYYQGLPDKKKRLALAMALSEKAKSGSIIVMEEINIKEPKTKNVAEILNQLKVSGKKVLCILEKKDDKLSKAGRNIPDLVLEDNRTFNAYEVLWADKIIITSKALENITSLRGVK